MEMNLSYQDFNSAHFSDSDGAHFDIIDDSDDGSDYNPLWEKVSVSSISGSLCS